MPPSDIQPVLVDLDGLAAAISISKRTLQNFYRELPHIRIPSSQGDDGRGVVFCVEDVKRYLINNYGINYGHTALPDTMSSGTKVKKEKTKPIIRRKDDDPHGLRKFVTQKKSESLTQESEDRKNTNKRRR